MPYRIGLQGRDIIKYEVDRMSKMKVIETAHSPWGSTAVVVPKPDGSKHFFVDCRRLNKMSIRDSYPLSRMSECIDSLGEEKNPNNIGL